MAVENCDMETFFKFFKKLIKTASIIGDDFYISSNGGYDKVITKFAINIFPIAGYKSCIENNEKSKKDIKKFCYRNFQDVCKEEEINIGDNSPFILFIVFCSGVCETIFNDYIKLIDVKYKIYKDQMVIWEISRNKIEDAMFFDLIDDLYPVSIKPVKR